MRPRESRGFSRSTLLLFLRFKRRSSALMARQTPLLGRAERSTPKARRGAPERGGGWRGKRAPSNNGLPANTLQTSLGLLLIPSFPVDVPITFVQLTPRQSPFAMRHSPHHLISGLRQAKAWKGGRM